MEDLRRSRSRRRPIYMMGAAGLIAASGWLAQPSAGACSLLATGAVGSTLVQGDGIGRTDAAADPGLAAVLLQPPPLPRPHVTLPLEPRPIREHRLPSLALAPKQGPPA